MNKKVLICMAGVLTFSCAVNTGLLSSNTGWCHLYKIQIVSDQKANGDSPTAVDIVIVKNSALAENLSAMDSFKWFKEKLSIQARYQKDVKIFSAELVPLSEKIFYLADDLPRYHATALIYVKYNNPAGRACTDITKFWNIEVRLSETNYSISEKGYWRLFCER
jgi:hypothetical protein